ncbi:MAG: YeiH family protein, partial [Burkholderiaceae bacterium]
SGRIGWLQSHGLSPLTVAILIGIVVGNTFYPRLAPACAPGVLASKQSLLRLGVVLYGFQLTFQDIGHVGATGVAIDALMLCSTLGLARFLGKRVFGMDSETATLIGAGSAICGAAAVMATAPVLRAKSENVTVAVSTVVVFGTLSIFLYPFLYQVNLQWHLLPATATAFGVYTGSTVHEVAQVVAAGRSIGPDVANAAVITKMVRVMMLAPFLLLLSGMRGRVAAKSAADAQDGGDRSRLAIPWFAFGFIAVAALNSLPLVPPPARAVLIGLDTALLAMAMSALGLTTHVSAVRSAGVRPILMATMLFAWLVVGGAAVNAGIRLLAG